MNVTPERFEEHLKLISKYKRDVEISFDDGYENNFTYAYPLLLKHKLTATFFITTDFIDGKIRSEQIWNGAPEAKPMTWENLAEMAAKGMKIGSHAKTHRILTTLSKEEMEEEITGSKKRIEEMLNIKVDSLTYPKGYPGTFSPETQKVLASSGYTHAYINIMGSGSSKSSDSYTLKRIRINAEDNLLRLKMKMEGAYDWVDRVKRFP